MTRLEAYKRWMRERKVLDRIDLADIPYGEETMTGPVITITRTFSGRIKERT